MVANNNSISIPCNLDDSMSHPVKPLEVTP